LLWPVPRKIFSGFAKPIVVGDLPLLVYLDRFCPEVCDRVPSGQADGRATLRPRA